MGALKKNFKSSLPLLYERRGLKSKRLIIPFSNRDNFPFLYDQI
jgi:hypothetical protein